MLPRQLIDVKALMGDASDNIPGVPGVGEKTATALIGEYGSLDEVYAHLEEITKPSLRAKLEENRELAYMSRMLGEIETQAPAPLGLSDLRVRTVRADVLNALLDRLELKSAKKKIAAMGWLSAQPEADGTDAPSLFSLLEEPSAEPAAAGSLLSAKEFSSKVKDFLYIYPNGGGFAAPLFRLVLRRRACLVPVRGRCGAGNPGAF